MLLSERELELSDEHTGIIELQPDAKVGSPAAAALGLDDAMFNVAITPNRPDCLGVRGIARDLAAAGLGKLKKDTIKPLKGNFANPIPIELDFDKESASACPIFAGRIVRNVKNGPSPAWLQKRLKAIGLRPINALVDITNYISYDRGRPLHVYDADKLHGAIRARLGRKGESFVALDGKTYEVDADMCVIADERAVLGLGGVMGGESSGVDGIHHQRLHRVRLISIRSARRALGAGSTSSPMRASGSSAVSIPLSSSLGLSLPRGSCLSFAAESRARSRSPARHLSRTPPSSSIPAWSHA